MTAPLKAMLRSLQRERGNILGGPVFIPHKRTGHARKWLVRQGLKKAKLEAKGIDAKKLAEFRFHDSRHTAASLMVAQGVPLFDVSKILGHKSLQMTMRYAHFAPEAGRAAIEALERALG